MVFGRLTCLHTDITVRLFYDGSLSLAVGVSQGKGQGRTIAHCVYKVCINNNRYVAIAIGELQISQQVRWRVREIVYHILDSADQFLRFCACRSRCSLSQMNKMY